MKFELPPYFSLAEAIDLGVNRRELERGLFEGDFRRLGHGMYGRARPERFGESWERVREAHLDRLTAELHRRQGHVGSHSSAALVHGLALSVAAGSPIELTAVDRYQTSRLCDGLVLHHADSLDAEVVEIDGLRVTSLDRTIADCLRTRRLPHGVALLDDALRRALTTRERIVAMLRGQLRWRGRPRARAAVHLADPRRESWLESYSFVTLHELGLTIPVPQVVVLDRSGGFVGRVDGLLTRSGVFLEADGRGKYFLDADPAAEGYADAVARTIEVEQERHESLERLGLRGVRWTADQILGQPDDVAQRLRKVEASADPSRFRGAVIIDGQRMSLPCDVDTPSLDDRPVRYRRERRAS